MSKLEVDKITPQSGTTLTIGDAGDTTVINGLGTLPATIGSAAQVLSVNAGATGLQYGTAVTDLSNLNATNLTSGTVPDARFPGTLPSTNGQNLTSLSPANLQGGTFPAVNSTNLTNLNATAITSGTLPDGRFPATLPAISGANLTNLPGGGKIAQVVRMEYGGHQSFTGSAGTYHNTGVTLNITPSATSSKVVGVAYIGTGASADVFTFTDVKNITSGTIVANRNGMCPRSAQVSKNNTTHAFLDSPNSTSAQTYTVRLDGGGATGYVNSRDSGNLNSYSGIVLMEVLV